MSEPGFAHYRKKRRSHRQEVALPIRIFGFTLRGRDFTEDCVCLKVSVHGAQIRLKHLLVPDDVIQITNLRNNQQAPYRVVCQVNNPPGVPYADWGVEALESSQRIWESQKAGLEPAKTSDNQLGPGQRRSPRTPLRVPVTVSWLLPAGFTREKESTETRVVNAHGALIHLQRPLARDTQVEIIHQQSGHYAYARVAWVGEPVPPKGTVPVGVELAVPNAGFWTPGLADQHTGTQRPA